MVSLLVGTDSAETSEAVAAYLDGIVTSEDAVYVVNSLPGGDETTQSDLDEGEAAIDLVVDRVGDQVAEIERRRFVRGNEPVEDLLSFASEVDADEIVLGVRKRTPAGKVVFGSTAQNVLLRTDRPVRCVPLE